jgi:hypothetical protein
VTEELEVLVTVKSSPVVGKKTGEAICVAGIRVDDGHQEWVRLFPFPFRDLPYERQFKKYQKIKVQAQKASSDTRPESWTPHYDTLELGDVLDTKKKWAARRVILDPLEVESMCEIRRRQELDGTSLGMFAPEDIELSIVHEPGDWDPAKAAALDQPSLFVPDKTRLERVPYRFKYDYRCSTPTCNGHSQTYIDWEITQAWRSWRYPIDEKLEKLRSKFLDEMCSPDKDTRIFVGNQHLHHDSFLVLGVFWPPRP